MQRCRPSGWAGRDMWRGCSPSGPGRRRCSMTDDAVDGHAEVGQDDGPKDAAAPVRLDGEGWRLVPGDMADVALHEGPCEDPESDLSQGRPQGPRLRVRGGPGGAECGRPGLQGP